MIERIKVQKQYGFTQNIMIHLCYVKSDTCNLKQFVHCYFFLNIILSMHLTNKMNHKIPLSVYYFTNYEMCFRETNIKKTNKKKHKNLTDLMHSSMSDVVTWLAKSGDAKIIIFNSSDLCNVMISG